MTTYIESEFDFYEIEDEFPKLYKIDFEENMKNKIVQLFLNSGRKNNINEIKKIYVLLDDILTTIKDKLNNNDINRDIIIHYLTITFKILINTRDIFHGKGERDISYCMIYCWYKHFPSIAKHAIKLFVIPSIINESKNSPLGSWLDMKHLCCFSKTFSGILKDDKRYYEEIIDFCIDISNKQLYSEFIKIDVDNHDYSNVEYILNFVNNEISRVAKWIPREKSKYGWLFDKYVINWFQQFDPCNTDKLNVKRKNYRKNISNINTRLLQTIEFYECSKKISEITLRNIGYNAAISKNNLFLNIKNNYSIRFPDNKEYINFSNSWITLRNLKHRNFYYDKFNISKYGSFVRISAFVKEAFKLYNDYDKYKDKSFYIENITILNEKWEFFSKKFNSSLDNCIPIINISESMDMESLYNAIGLGILISEKSTINKRIVVFNHQATWINLQNCNSDFFSMFIYIYNNTGFVSTSSNIYTAFDLLIKSMLETDISIEDITSLNLIVLSNSNTINHENIIKMFSDVNYNDYPHIIYWNLSKEFFEINNFYNNMTIVSGFSTYILKYFMKYGLESLHNTKCYNVIVHLLKNVRYDYMSNNIINLQ